MLSKDGNRSGIKRKTPDNAWNQELLRDLPGVTEVSELPCDEADGHLLVIHHEMHADLRAQVSSLCAQSGCALLEESSGSDALEDAFLHVIGRKGEV